MQQGHVESYYLESTVGSITNQKRVPFGDGIISTDDTCFACETCEELFTPMAPRKLQYSNILPHLRKALRKV